MSVEYALYYVDWDDFSEKAAKAEDAYEFMSEIPPVTEADTWFRHGMEAIETIDQLLKTYYTDENPTGFFQKFMRRLDDRIATSSEAKPEIDKLNRFLSHLFWGWRDKSYRIMQLETEFEMMEVAMAPATVKEYAALGADIDFDKIAPRYAKFGVKSGVGDYDAFVGFCRKWIAFVERCASEGKGLLIYVYG